jgi:hypothetical protein
MRAINASLDPTDFRHEAADRGTKLTISQVDHGIQTRSIAELYVPCACGRPLCGLEFDWLSDAGGQALHFMGVCLVCGVQRGIYMSEPVLAVKAQEARRDAKLEADVRELMEQVARLRQANEMQDAAEAAEKVA